MSVVTEETGLSTRTEQSFELAQTSAAAAAQFEIQSAIIIARRFPRNEDQAFEKLMRACKRLSFAEDAAYAFPRGGETVEGPSVNLAREAARVWGNIRHGLDVIRDDETSRQIRGWAWDLETNTKVSAEDEFAKLIYRKKGGWQKPDERDLRELTNRRGAILVRNCILQVLPKDLIEDALHRSKETIREGAASDPETTRKRLILAFSELNVTPDMIEHALGHPIAQCSPKELADLRTVYKSIADGNSTWAEYIGTNGKDNGEEPKRKSESFPTTPEQKPAQQSTNSTNGASSTSAALPIDTSKVYKVIDVVVGKKGEPFKVTITGGVILQCSDQRLFIVAKSAVQSGSDVIVNGRQDGEALVLTDIEELG